MKETFSWFQFTVLFGSLAIAVIAAFLLHVRKNFKWAMFFLFLSAFFLRFAIIFFDPYLNWWDERYHAVVAKNLMQNPLKPVLYPSEELPHTTSWIRCHVWLHKPPLFLWQSALTMAIFGVNVYAFRLPGVILSFFALLLVYDIARRWMNRYIAFYAVLLMAFSSYTLDLVSGYHTSEQNDISFIFYVTLSIWSLACYLERPHWKWMILIAMSAGAAVLTKWLMGLVVFVVWGLLILLQRDMRWDLSRYVHLASTFVIAILIALPWNLYAYVQFHEMYLFEMQEKARHLSEVVEGHGGGLLWHWENFRVIYAKGVQWLIIPGLFFFWKRMKNARIRLMFLLFFFFVLIFFSIAKTKMLAFTLIAQSVVFLSLGALIYELFLFLKPRYAYYRRYGQISAVVILGLLGLWMLDVDSIRSKHTCWKRDYCYHRTRWIHSTNIFKKLSEEKSIPAGSVFLNLREADYPLLMFFTDHIGYSGLLDEYGMQQLNKTGRLVYVFIKPGVEEFLQTYPWVKPIDLDYWKEDFGQ